MLSSPPQSPSFVFDSIPLSPLRLELSLFDWDSLFSSSSLFVDPLALHHDDTNSILPIDFPPFSPSLSSPSLDFSPPLSLPSPSSLSPQHLHQTRRVRIPFKRPTQLPTSWTSSSTAIPCASSSTYQRGHMCKPQRRPTMKLFWQAYSNIPFPRSLPTRFENYKLGEIIEQDRMSHRAVFLTDESAKMINADEATIALLNPRRDPGFSCFHTINADSFAVCGYFKHAVVTNGRCLRGVTIKFNVNQQPIIFCCNLTPLRYTPDGPVTAVQVNFISHSSLSFQQQRNSQ